MGWLVCLACVMVAPGALSAHAKLLGTSPAAGARLEAAPRELTLKFDEPVQLAVLKLSHDGSAIPLAFDRRAAPLAQVSVTLPTLAAGTYEVRWSALTADDGHVVKGSFSFVIAAAAKQS